MNLRRIDIRKYLYRISLQENGKIISISVCISRERKSEINLSHQKLKNQPLIESIFEIRWNLTEISPGTFTDPNYQLLIGQLYSRIKSQYPFHEQLPTTLMPIDMAKYVIQHRFRKEKDAWPLVQIGPGILTINETEEYYWPDFEKNIGEILTVFFDIYPNFDSELEINRLLLRYIDAIEFNYEENNIFSFLEEKMKLHLRIEDTLLSSNEIEGYPYLLDLRLSFPSNHPKGALSLRFRKGQKKGADALIWETSIESLKGDTPHNILGIKDWLISAHNLSHKWFFESLDEGLLRRFR